jgi:hypothetical protein
MSTHQGIASLLILLLTSTGCGGLRDPKTEEPEQRRYSGVWIDEFEGSTFLEGIDRAPDKRPDYEGTAWLNYSLPEQIYGPGYDASAGCYALSAYKVEFIGREKRSRNGSGHLGLWGSEIDVLKMIKAEPIASPKCATYGDG